MRLRVRTARSAREAVAERGDSARRRVARVNGRFRAGRVASLPGRELPRCDGTISRSPGLRHDVRTFISCGVIPAWARLAAACRLQAAGKALSARQRLPCLRRAHPHHHATLSNSAIKQVSCVAHGEERVAWRLRLDCSRDFGTRAQLAPFAPAPPPSTPPRYRSPPLTLAINENK
jgi:hypothetical protein